MPNRVVLLGLLALLAGCDERERLTFPSNEPEAQGPVTTIETPSADSFLTEGPPFIIAGRTVDEDGVDTVYFEVFGTGQGFPPLSGGGETTVSFGLPLPTLGLAGRTVTIRVHGVDLLGNEGATTIRQLMIE